MNTKPIIHFEDVQPDCHYSFNHPLNISLEQGENWIVYGPNGSGKTFLTETMRSSYKLKSGKITYNFNNTRSQRACDNISYVTFLDQYTGSVNTGATAYQMRWNQGVIDEIFEPRVKDSLHKLDRLPEELRNTLLSRLNISDMMERTVISLSSGEFRRFQLVQILVNNPTVLIIDNPYIGLDTEGRQTVASLLDDIMKVLHITLILVMSRMPQSLSGFTHAIEVDDGNVSKISVEEFKKKHQDSKITEKKNNIAKSTNPNIVMEAKNISIRYGARTIIKDFSLQIREGEHWAIKGQNGSGKSTLLSLICADNPQGYACDITLFGRKRGTGESIWDIKKNIGFVSPEMFRSYRRNIPVKDIVASGLYDTNGLFRKAKEEDYAQITHWMDVFDINKWADRSYLTLSSGEQRLVLLCRAFVKTPPLLILDEPFHGLDEANRLKAKEIISNYCSNPKHTLIMVSHYDEDFPSEIDHILQLTKIE